MAETSEVGRAGAGLPAQANLIAAERVAGSAVRRSDGTPIGTIDGLMVDKPSGRVVYALMTTAGSEAVRGRTHALPWSLLRYNTSLDAYELNLTDAQLQSAPRQPGNEDPLFDREWEEHVHRYFDTEPYWGMDAPRATDSPLAKR